MTIEESIAFYEQQAKFGVKLGLDTVRDLLHRLDNPQNELTYLHVAGTNGKGSTSAFLSTILMEAGYRVGLYTSPALERFNERIQINNVPIADEAIIRQTIRIQQAVEEMKKDGANLPSQFELETALAFLCFREAEVDLVVLEVGMGGRLDATNVISKPLVSLICSISLDHTQYLGNTLAAIAGEKAGIIKYGCPVVLYPQEEEVEKTVEAVAKQQNAPVTKPDFQTLIRENASLDGQRFHWTDDEGKTWSISLSLMGDYQMMNAIMALSAITLLRRRGMISVDDETILRGLEKTAWKGRFERVLDSPLTILDGAHNVGGARVFTESVKDFLSNREIVMVLGILADKEIDKMLALFLPLAKHVITLTPDNPRAMSAKELAEEIQKRGGEATPCENLDEAWMTAKTFCTSKNSAVVFVGSLYMVGYVRSFLKR